MSTAQQTSTETLPLLEAEIINFKELLGIKDNPGKIEATIKNDVAKLLATEAIQFLKQRFQMGLVHKVSDEWKKVEHTRFEHTIGVIAKCIVACDLINQNCETQGISSQLTIQDARELAAAAALHDCGHFPISHATERAFLTSKGWTKSVKHEERIASLIIINNPLLKDVRELILGWDSSSDMSLYRIATIIYPKMADEFIRTISGFERPKRAIQQLLVSDIDMDRLDYVIRDSFMVKYAPVTLINERIVKYVKGLSLEKFDSISGGWPRDNVELCLNKESKDDNYIESVFSFLVSRVLLYKYIYFSEKLRSFEAILTYLVGTLIEKEVALEPLKLIAMSDTDFINFHLKEYVGFIDGPEKFRKELIDKYINVLKEEKAGRFHHLLSIHSKKIKHPRLKEEFINNIDSRAYIDNLRDKIFNEATTLGMTVKKSDLLLDVFHLKTGGGELLVKSEVKGKTHYETLKANMNGSNMHNLCSETRLDIYIKSDLSDKNRIGIKKIITKFFKYDDYEYV